MQNLQRTDFTYSFGMTEQICTYSQMEIKNVFNGEISQFYVDVSACLFEVSCTKIVSTLGDYYYY